LQRLQHCADVRATALRKTVGKLTNQKCIRKGNRELQNHLHRSFKRSPVDGQFVFCLLIKSELIKDSFNGNELLVN